MKNRVEQKLSSSNLRRRVFLRRLAAAPFTLAFPANLRQSAIGNLQSLAFAQQPPVTMANAPHSRAFPFASLNSWITPTADFFVRSHFGVPAMKTSRWTLEVKGAVERARTFSLEEILKLPVQEEVVTLECSGNPVGWGGVSNARWTGVRLSHLLEACGVRADA